MVAALSALTTHLPLIAILASDSQHACSMESKTPDVEENPSRFYNSEKPTGSDSYASSDSQPDWTEEEEKKLVRKIDLILMPLLILPFIALQLDRGNMSVPPRPFLNASLY